jgi:hypothetical protein
MVDITINSKIGVIKQPWQTGVNFCIFYYQKFIILHNGLLLVATLQMHRKMKLGLLRVRQLVVHVELGKQKW